EQRDAIVEPRVAPGDAGPESLLLLVEVARVDALPLPLDDREPAADVRRHRDEPGCRRELAPGLALDPAAGRRGDPCALPVEVGAEQRVQGDDAIAVSRTLLDEVDDDSRLFAR